MFNPYVVERTIPMYEYSKPTWYSRYQENRYIKKQLDYLLGKDYTLVTALVISVIVVLLIVFSVGVACAEEDILYVCVNKDSYLNGRARPSTSAEITMKLYNGDTVEVVGSHGEWIEIIGGESGTSFVKAKYISETLDPYTITNISGGRVRIRSCIDGETVGYVKAGKSVKVTRTMLGWGYIGSGWVDLEYFK